ncbi:hypothetical protein KJ603_02625 [Patescibacteria group bacterium]|nr:hypothetical protein [Patescibacteria group bacterium]
MTKGHKMSKREKENMMNNFDRYKENYYALIVSALTQKSCSESLTDMGLDNPYEYRLGGGNKNPELNLNLEILSEMYYNGLTYKEIADFFQCSQASVYNYIVKYKLERRNRPKGGQGL